MGLKENIYINLKGGDRVTLRNGDVLSYDEYYDKITSLEDSRTNYTDTLKHKTKREFDIVEVKRPVDFTTIFTESDRTEDDEEVEDVTTDAVLEKIKNELTNTEIKKGTTIIIRL